MLPDCLIGWLMFDNIIALWKRLMSSDMLDKNWFERVTHCLLPNWILYFTVKKIKQVQVK